MSLKKWYLIVALAFAVSLAAAGCNTGEAPPAEDLAASTAPPLPATHAPPWEGPFFVPVSEVPVFPHGSEGDWYAGVVEPGAIFRHQGQYHLFFNGFEVWPAKSAVGYAVSSDGLSWTLVSPDPLLDSAAADFQGYTFFVSSVMQLDAQRWAMYLYTLDEGRDGAPGNILMATADELAGPWTLQTKPVLTPGKAGAWDGTRVSQPSVLKLDDGYRMYFSGYENDRLQGGRWIGMANSNDGFTWVKQPEPVFYYSDEPRDWDAFRVFQPRVVKTDDGFAMLYKSNVSVGRNEGIGMAFSEDGILWERFEENPVIDEKTYALEWRRNGIAELLYVDGRFELFLEILEREGGAYHHGNKTYRSNIYRFISAGLH